MWISHCHLCLWDRILLRNNLSVTKENNKNYFRTYFCHGSIMLYVKVYLFSNYFIEYLYVPGVLLRS